MLANEKALHEVDETDPMDKVDMMPWRAVRAMYLVTIALWFVLLAGRVVECATGERALLTVPGLPPWSRTGQWDGWEHGPITSKHYAHVTPMRGHFAWKYGQGPNGFVEIWPSDLYGFAPEADMWWADEQNPKLNAKPGIAQHVIPSYPMDVFPHPPNYEHNGHVKTGGHTTPDAPDNDAMAKGANRRLSKKFMQANVVRTLVPAAVKWPALLEPDFVACAPLAGGNQVAAFSTMGRGALISEEAALGKVPAAAVPFSLEGLPSPVFARGVTWSHDGLIVVSGRGSLHNCGHGDKTRKFQCQNITGPALPLVDDQTGPLPAVMIAGGNDGLRFAAVAAEGGEVKLMKLALGWELMAKVQLPFMADSLDAAQPSVVALSAAEDHLIVTASDGATYRWELQAGLPVSTPHREAPAGLEAYAAVGAPRTWRGACLLPSGSIIRLASRWQKSGGAGALAWHPELLF